MHRAVGYGSLGRERVAVSTVRISRPLIVASPRSRVAVECEPTGLNPSLSSREERRLHWYIKGGQDKHMRNVIFAINITIDGCCDHTKMIADEEIHEYFTHLMRDVDLLVFGRKTHQLMVPYWPDIAKSQSETKAENEFARTFDSINKIVFSRSLDSAADKNTRIVRTNLHDEILKLKQERGKHILVGGVDVPTQLIKLGLVDEYRFVVQPIVAGEGRRLLEGVSLQERLQLIFVESKIFKSGCVALRYLKQ
jgi:dihydrofolate reductase